MTDVIRLELDVPPSARDYWRVWRNRAVRTTVAEGYCNRVLLAARNRGIRPFPPSTPVAIEVRWYRAMKMGDLDNRLKILLDSLQSVAYVNDKQIVELHAYRYEDREKPRCEVEVRAA